MRVLLFIPCLTDVFAARAGEATVRLLEHLGCEVDYPRGQTCCGQPLFNDGHRRDAARIVARMARVFRGDAPIVTPSSSCAAFVQVRAPELLPGGDGARLAARTHELGGFLQDVLGVDVAAMTGRWRGRARIHSPCHARELPGGDRAGELLGGVDGLEAAPLDPSGQCCGFGGSFATRHPAVSGALLADKVAAIRAAGPDAIVCGDAGCGLHLAGGCHRAGVTEPRFLHVAELLAEALGLMPRPPRPLRDAHG